MKALQPGETVVETATNPDEAWEKASGLARVIRVMGWQDSYGVTVRMMRGGRKPRYFVVVASYDGVPDVNSGPWQCVPARLR